MIFRWVLTAYLVLEITCTALNIDAPRDPLTRGAAVAALLINGLIIYGLFNWL